MLGELETRRQKWSRIALEPALLIPPLPAEHQWAARRWRSSLLIHGTPGLEQMSGQQAMKIHAELVKLRDERVTRFVGLSAHGYFDKALALIASGGFDLCMLSNDPRVRWTTGISLAAKPCSRVNEKHREHGQRFVPVSPQRRLPPAEGRTRIYPR